MALVKDMGFNLSPLYLFGGLVFTAVGLYYWREGRRRHYSRTKWLGVVIMSFPIFISNTFLMWCVGIFLWALAYHLKAEGQ